MTCNACSNSKILLLPATRIFRLKHSIILCILFSMFVGFAFAQTPTRPNVLMICVDDLNDWVGCLGGHPQAKTPQIDRLAKRGILFENAHCAAPRCNPSRVATLSGLNPGSTGVYENRYYWPAALPNLNTITRGWVRRVCSSNIEKVAPNKKAIEPETVQNVHSVQIRSILTNRRISIPQIALNSLASLQSSLPYDEATIPPSRPAMLGALPPSRS